MAAGKSSLSKEAKTALKAAKEAIKNKEFKEALKQCKIVLKQDKAHYNGLVFVGVAAAELGQLDQGVAAYKKAINVDPSQELAWQGLCSLYEKSQTPDHKAALTEAYSKVMQIFEGKDAAKWLKFARKYIQALLDDGSKEEVLTELDRIIQSGHCSDSQTILELQMQYVDVVSSERALQETFKGKVEQTFQAILTSTIAKKEEKKRFHKEYIKFILHRDAEVVKAECARMHEEHPSDPYPISVLVEFNLQQGIDGLSDDAFIALENLRALDSSHPLISVAEGQTKLSRKNYQEAMESLIRGVSSVPTNPYSWLYKAHAHLGLHENKSVETSILQGLRALKAYSFPGVDKKYLEQQFLLLHSMAMLDSGGAGNAAKALVITEKLLKEGHEASKGVKIAHIQALLQNGKLGEAKEFFSEIAGGSLTPREKVEVKVTEGQMAFMEGKLQDSLECFQEASPSDVDNALALYWQGRVYWELGGDARSDKSKCFDCLKKAASMDPHHAETFLYLGYFFLKVAEDLNKSMQCFKKSYQLNPESEEAGSMLGDSLIALGQQETAFELYNSVTSRAAAGTAKWAWLRLGLYHFKFGDPTDAINCFQSALRADPTDKECWECLGDAYMKRGSYTAAMKTFTRGIELGGSTTYCRYQIASIKQTLGLYSEAVTEYDEVLAETKDYVPALKGQGETFIRLARISLVEFFNGRAVDYVGRAINTVARASVLRPDLCSVWSLLGTACSLLYKLDKDLIRVDVPASLLPSVKSSKATESRSLGKSELLALGARCYTRALQLQPESGRLWCDLGVNYFHQSQNSKDNEAMLAAKAFQCIHKAINLDSSNHQYWNTLGLVCNSNGINRPSLSQHCFIKSIQLEKNNVVAWTNLGVLYLTKGDIKLAHQAFKVSQSLEPNYVQCWIGQAIIAESVGSDEAMDLFRHTTELSTHNEGSIGYAHWVCQTLLDCSLDKTSQLYLYSILQMNAIQQATVTIGKHNDRCHSDPSALMLQGLLLERQNLHRSALEAFRRCVALLETNADGDKLDAARVNYARCLSACGEYDEAVRQHEALSSMTDSASLLGYALCLYKAGNYQKSFQVYESLLESCQNPDDEVHILAALGMVAHKCGDVTQAKTMLFKSHQKSPLSEPGLKALCALGLKLNDATLTQAVVAELEKTSTDPSKVQDLALLKCALYLMQGHPKKASRSMIAHIHRYPWLANIWQATATVIVKKLPRSAELAAIMMQSVHHLQKSPSDSSTHVRAVCDLAAGRCIRTTNRRRSCVVSAQRAVFLFPDNLNNWSLLAASLVGEALISGPIRPGKKETLDRCLSFVNQQAKLLKDEPLEQWSVVLSLWWTLYKCQYDQCIELAKTYTEWCNYPEDIMKQIELVSRLAESLKLNRRYWEVENLKELKSAVARSPSPLALQVLGSLYLRGGLIHAAKHCYQQAWTGSGGSQADLLKLCKLALDATGKFEQQDEWLTLAKETFSEASRNKINGSVACIGLLQGLLKQLEGNQRSKKGFQSVLASPWSSTMAVSVARYQLIKLLASKDEAAALDILETARSTRDPHLMLLEELVE